MTQMLPRMAEVIALGNLSTRHLLRDLTALFESPSSVSLERTVFVCKKIESICRRALAGAQKIHDMRLIPASDSRHEFETHRMLYQALQDREEWEPAHFLRLLNKATRDALTLYVTYQPVLLQFTDDEEREFVLECVKQLRELAERGRLNLL
jgi:hypothetical protein